MKTIGILTSGGDAPGMNAAIRAVVRTGIYNGFKVMGIKDGYDGLIKGNISEMTLSSVGDTIHKGGTILRSARSEDFKTEEGQKKALSVLDIFNIDGLVVIGGDGTLRGAKQLSVLGVPVIGLPATIDNDLAYTEFTIGFHTVVNTVVNLMGNLRDTSASHGRANIVEVMGRACGDIALHAGLAGGAESIIVPEEKIEINEICKKLIKGRSRGKRHSIIVLAEGAGNAYELKEQIEEKTGIDTRVTILGHIQRGGTPTATDRILSSKMGARAVTLLMEGNSGKAVGIQGNKIIDMDIGEALEIKKEFDNESYLLSKILSI